MFAASLGSDVKATSTAARAPARTAITRIRRGKSSKVLLPSSYRSQSQSDTDYIERSICATRNFASFPGYVTLARRSATSSPQILSAPLRIPSHRFLQLETVLFRVRSDGFQPRRTKGPRRWQDNAARLPCDALFLFALLSNSAAPHFQLKKLFVCFLW
ncbi:hypothetical protein L596_008334 [Steinernema carpocapsae]|uniref:Uncharacterized protein n=1 Tax=Steinernema carpocapsae TaxID=34508 RepID=A0A4U5PCF5_STECR|nr:hypothetical protein L596_008334 [Steinernema carpocapsae]